MIHPELLVKESNEAIIHSISCQKHVLRVGQLGLKFKNQTIMLSKFYKISGIIIMLYCHNKAFEIDA